MRILVVEAHSGISGDMFVAAAAQLAGCEKEVAELPGKLGLPGVTCSFHDAARASIQCRKFDVMDGARPAEDTPHPRVRLQEFEARGGASTGHRRARQ